MKNISSILLVVLIVFFAMGCATYGDTEGYSDVFSGGPDNPALGVRNVITKTYDTPFEELSPHLIASVLELGKAPNIHIGNVGEFLGLQTFPTQLSYIRGGRALFMKKLDYSKEFTISAYYPEPGFILTFPSELHLHAIPNESKTDIILYEYGWLPYSLDAVIKQIDEFE